MYFDDHLPPHIHVEYQGAEALVAIDTGDLIEGRLPKKAAKLIRNWCLDHQAELQDTGQLAARRLAAAAATHSRSRQ